MLFAAALVAAWARAAALSIKQQQPIEKAHHGVYSFPLNKSWIGEWCWQIQIRRIRLRK